MSAAPTATKYHQSDPSSACTSRLGRIDPTAPTSDRICRISAMSWPISARSHPVPGGGSGPSGSYRSMQSVQSGSALQTCGEARKEDEGQGRDEAGPGSSHIDIIRCAKCPVIVDEARMMRHVVAAPRPKKSTLVKRLVRIPFHTGVVTIRFSQLTGRSSSVYSDSSTVSSAVLSSKCFICSCSLRYLVRAHPGRPRHRGCPRLCWRFARTRQCSSARPCACSDLPARTRPGCRCRNWRCERGADA